MRFKTETLQAADSRKVILFRQKEILMSARKTKDRTKKQIPFMVIVDWSQSRNSPDDLPRHISAE
jgi:hypothetical protein